MTESSVLTSVLDASVLPATVVELPTAHRTVAIATLLRHERRAAASIDRVKHCWAPNKIAIDLDGEVTWPELALVRLLERAGWEARWIKNWSGGRESCAAVGEPRPLTGAGADAFDRIHAHAPGLRGAGTWDVLAWRDDEVLFLESKQHRSSDRLRDSQVAFLEAAIEVGLDPSAFVVVVYDAGRPVGRTERAVRFTPEVAARPDTDDGRGAPIDALCAEAIDAPASTRVGLYRDRLAAYGSEALPSIEAWVDEGRSPGFAIAVAERIGHQGDRDDALRTLGHIGATAPDWADFAYEAAARLRDQARPAPHPPVHTAQGGEYVATGTPPPAFGYCGVRNRDGTDCQNSGRHPVRDILSCTTHYKALTRRGLDRG